MKVRRPAPPLLTDILPELAKELEILLNAKGEISLAGQVAELRIVDRCHCGDDFCSTFYTHQSKPNGVCRNIELDPETGMLVLEVIDEQIVAVEVLYRDEIRDKLRALLR